MKYIIKNCLALLPRTKLCDSENMKTPPDFCENITDCLLKQIVATCKQEININDKDAPTNAYAMGRVVVAEKILELLGIEEVDE